jgi:hypothetical protein
MLVFSFPIYIYILYRIPFFVFLVGKRENFASFATFLNVYKGLGVIKSTCSQHFHHFIAGLQRFWSSHDIVFGLYPHLTLSPATGKRLFLTTGGADSNFSSEIFGFL